MKYFSVCSGIEAASAAWEPLGWECAGLAEVEPFPCHVLAHRFGASRPAFMPNPGEDGISIKTMRARKAALKAIHKLPEKGRIHNYGDITRFREWTDVPRFDLIVGGTPCQSFSVAGLRQGLADPRGNLMLTYLAIAGQHRPEWVVWENVPGVLSADGGRAFGAFIKGLEELGYHAAWRVLDAQHVRVDGFGRAVPQRRRRVFVVGHLGDWRRAAAVLFDRESLSWGFAPRRQARERVASGVEVSARVCGEVAPTLNAAFGSKLGLENQHIDGGGGLFVAFTAKDYGADAETGSHANAGVMPAIAVSIRGREGGSTAELGGYVSTAIRSSQGGGDKPHVLAFDARQSDVLQYGNISGPMDTGFPGPSVSVNSSVRRLMPIECERLQGFPDNWTNVPYRGKPAADGPRYKAIGNSKAVNVVRWIGRRIDMVNKIGRTG